MPKDNSQARIVDLLNGRLDIAVGLDTNVLIYAHAYELFLKEDLIPDSRLNRASLKNYLDFLERLGYENVPGFYSIFNINEIRHICQKLTAKREAVRIGISEDKWQDVYYQNPHLRTESNDLANKILTSIKGTPYLQYMDIYNEKALQPIVNELLTDTFINVTDAHIIAVQLQYEMNSIASDDKMFNQVKGINLYTANSDNLSLVDKSRSLTSFNETEGLYRSIRKNDSPSIDGTGELLGNTSEL